MKIKPLLFAAAVIALGDAVSFGIYESSQRVKAEQPQIQTPLVETGQTEIVKTEDKSQKQNIGVDVGIVTAIMYVDDNPLAVVDGIILREGQSIRQVKIIKINPDSVEFEYEGTRWSQQVNKPRSTQYISTINSRMLSKNMSVEDIVKYVSPAVVTIVAYDDTGDPLTLGSGFFIGNGKILTNAHVIEGAYSAEVSSLLKTYEEVTIVKRDDDVDLAVLEVNSVGESIISLADDSDLRVGQRILAIGNPEGLERTVSDGIISAIRDWEGVQNIQITAPISGGSSGGPLLNMQGSVIGVIYAGFDEGQNLNLAVGIETIKQFLQSPENPEKLKKAHTGEHNLNWALDTFFVIAILAIVAPLSLYIMIKLYRLVTRFLRRKKILDSAPAEEEPYQPVALSSKKSERNWRSM